MTRPARFPLRLLVLLALALLLAARALPAAAQQSEADVAVAQAVLAYADQRYDDALRLLREALQHDPDHVDALYYTGLVHMARRQVDAAVPALERAHALAPRDRAITFQLGLAYFSVERYDSAEPLLTEVFTADPSTEGLGYYVGFLRYRRRDYEGALRAFSAGTASDPSIRQLTRFYSGLANAMLGRPDRAVAEVEAALRAQPVSPLTGPAERLRDSIAAARVPDRRFRVELRAGGLYDSNVVAAPEASHDPGAEAARDRDKASFGALLGARAEYVWFKRGPWESALAYSFFQIINSDRPDFNIQNHLGTVSGTYVGALRAMPYQLNAQYAYDYLTLDDDEFLQRHTGTFTAALVETARHVSVGQLRYQHKEFSDDASLPRRDVRDAENWLVGLTHLLRFAGDRHFIRAGYQLDLDQAEGKNYDYVGHRFQFGAQYTLRWGELRLRYDYDLHVRDYLRHHSTLPAAAPNTRERYDVEQTHVVRVEKPLPHGFTLSAEYQGIVSDSNLAVFSFNRNVFSLTLSWQY